MSDSESSVGHFPSSSKWEFDDGVTRVFDDMIARSIPQYQVMRQTVSDVAAEFRIPDLAFLDLGCSRGESLEPLVRRFYGGNTFIGVDVSEPMLEAARERFRGQERVEIRKCDLRSEFPVGPSETCVVLSVLTLQFTPINYRQQILERAREAIAPGGAMILVEKVLGSGGRVDDLMVRNYHLTKERNGYGKDEIERKRLALEGVLVPVTAEWNVELLRRAGFSQADCFWRWMNFAAWVAIR